MAQEKLDNLSRTKTQSQLSNTSSTTHFGYEEVPTEDKQQHVNAVFDHVASSYDHMNDIMSFGLHHWWKAYSLAIARIKPGQHILDLACGTGDLSLIIAKKLEFKGYLWYSDINHNMLQQARTRMLNRGYHKHVAPLLANGEHLPLESDTLDTITLSFGLRNMTNKAACLAECARVLKPGGALHVLEFSHPTLPGFKQLYDWYSFNVIPRVGEWVTGDRPAYQYLVESIRQHPKAEDLRLMFLNNGFDQCDITRYAGGIVALHSGVCFE